MNTYEEIVTSLIAAANTKTGENNTTLTDAVQTLCDGYGSGASARGATAYGGIENQSFGTMVRISAFKEVE